MPWLKRVLNAFSGRDRQREQMNQAKYIVVEGPIGVGKTSLVRILAQELNARTVFEVVEENPFLSSFYSDRQKHAFQTQLFFLLSRFKQQQDLFQQDLFHKFTVSDYFFAKDRIFAGLTLDSNELALYERIYSLLQPRIVKPDMVIYLEARLDVLLAQIKKRGRAFEKMFDADYLTQVCSAYTDFFRYYDERPVLIVDSSDIDFVGNLQDRANLLHAIYAAGEGRTYYRPKTPVPPPIG